MHLPEIDRYAHLKSPLHSWDPRIKLVSISCLILSIVLLPNLLLASIGLFFAVVLIFLSRVPFSFVLMHLRWVLLFVLFFFVVMPLTVPGERVVDLNFVAISYEGIELASLIALRAIGAVLLVFPMIGTMRFDLTIKALQKLKVPNKFVQLIMFTYRYIFVFLEELRRMFVAARARTFRKGTNVHTLKIVSNLIGMLFIRSFERTQRIYNAMASRGYSGDLKTLDEFELCRKDFLKAFIVIAMAVILHLAPLQRVVTGFAGWVL